MTTNTEEEGANSVTDQPAEDAPAEAPATYDASPVHSAYDADVVAAYDADASRAAAEPAFAPAPPPPPREPEPAYDHHAFPAQTYGQDDRSAAYAAGPGPGYGGFRAPGAPGSLGSNCGLGRAVVPSGVGLSGLVR